ncbi:plant UBX domain-containing protein 7-like isoform X2 [Papaver somniferum]|uniref:plant UBX domain-containing protein 7-like isoform X2 n=1 Tax=Papaver somniferum TaxID=3469 RepID=UPI000E70038B|nr:plant UBX domain-containing protein 7-like isoform X2 [Papaver somniferum]
MGHPPYVAFGNFNEELKHPGVWEPEQGAPSTADNSRDNLVSLCCPPFEVTYKGPFNKELLSFMDGGPKDHHVAVPHKRSRKTSQAPTLKPKGKKKKT